MYRSTVAALASAVLAVSAPAFAASPIDGTWKADTASAKLTTKPDVLVLKDATYTCSSCVPAYSIPADGKRHAVAGRDYWDEAAVTIVDSSTVSMTRYRKGTEVGTSKITVSADGTMLTWSNSSSDNAGGKLLTSSSMSKRSAPGPAGAHAVSGSWLGVNEGAQIAEEALIVTISSKGKAVTMTLGTGEHYTAVIGGPRVPFVGDKAGAMVALKPMGKGFVETDYVNGKAIGAYTYLPVNATTMTFKASDLKRGTTDEFTLTKQ